MAEERPRLRRDLVARPIESDGVSYIEVTDPRVDRSFRMYEVEHAIAGLLDGRPVNVVVDEARELTGLDLTLDQLLAFVGRLRELRFIESPPPAPPPYLEAAAAAKETPPPETVPDIGADAVPLPSLDSEPILLPEFPSAVPATAAEPSGPHDRPAPPDEEALRARRNDQSPDLKATKELPAFLAERDSLSAFSIAGELGGSKDTAKKYEERERELERERERERQLERERERERAKEAQPPPRRLSPARPFPAVEAKKRPTGEVRRLTPGNGVRALREDRPPAPVAPIHDTVVVRSPFEDVVPTPPPVREPEREQKRERPREPEAAVPERAAPPPPAAPVRRPTPASVTPLFPPAPPAPPMVSAAPADSLASLLPPPPPPAIGVPDVFPAAPPAGVREPTTLGVAARALETSSRAASRWKTYAAAGVGAALLVGLIVFGLLSTSPGGPATVAVRTVRPRATSVHRWFDAAGVIKPAGGRVAHFTSGGKVTAVLGAGAKFDAGAVIAELATSKRVRTELEHVQSRLAFYEKQLEESRAANNRPEIRQAELKIAEKKRLIAEAQASLAKSAVIAEGPGQVEEPLTTVGATVKPGAPAVRIKGTAWLAEVELPREEADQLRHLGFCRAEIDGKSLACSLTAEGGDETHVLIDLPEDPAVAAGKKVKVAKARYDNVLVLPASVLAATKGSDRRVFVAKNGRADAYVVNLADQTATEVVVTQGIEPDAQVVVNPPAELQTRTPIKIVDGK